MSSGAKIAKNAAWLMGVIALVVVLSMVFLPKRFQSQKITQPGKGNLRIEWAGSVRGVKDFSVEFLSREASALVDCSLRFDNQTFPISSLRMNTPDVKIWSDHYSARVERIEPNTIYEIGQNSDSAGVSLTQAPKNVRLDCQNTYSEWMTGF